MKNLVKNTKYILLACIVAFSFACSAEDGEDGAVGPAGPAGTDGTNGTDGNANVQVLTIDATSFAGSSDDVTVPELTQDVIDNDVVLGYLTDDGTNWVPVPCPFDTYQFDFSVHVTLTDGFYSLDYGDGSGNALSISAGDLQTLKVVIIEATTAAKSSNKKQHVYSELEQAGVNSNDYYAVCNYYGIAY
ncbi:collagen-like triple helix repeat-containing protein [Lacinutrix salivirga]